MQKPHLELAKTFWKNHLSPQDGAIDATLGNGHDTLFLASLLKKGYVAGFDIQEAAIESTKKRLEACTNSKIFLHQRSHADIDCILLPYPPKLIVYNLGYLPGGDKSITTQTGSTLASLEKALKMLGPEGALSITCYPGHEDGAKEQEALTVWAQGLDRKIWQVEHYRWKEKSPSLLWIERL